MRYVSSFCGAWHGRKSRTRRTGPTKDRKVRRIGASSIRRTPRAPPAMRSRRSIFQHAKPAELPPLGFEYRSVPLNIINNGHTIQVNYGPGSTLTVGDKTYALKQFHFHHPSEESIDGRGFDLVAHLVHDDGSGHLAVVAVLFKTGPLNTLLEAVWRNIPAQMGKAADVPSVSLNVTDLLPADHGYYTFAGSLTTPPCSEGVTWYVLKNQATLSADQLAAFAKLYPRNARPIQPAYGRAVLESQ